MPNLLNKKAVRTYILEQAKVVHPGWRCERVSAGIINELEARLRVIIKRALHQHPSTGKTFNQML